MDFELKVFRDDKAQPVALEVVTEHYRTKADDLAKKNHLGAFIGGSMDTRSYENGVIFVSPITDEQEK